MEVESNEIQLKGKPKVTKWKLKVTKSNLPPLTKERLRTATLNKATTSK